MAGMKGVVWQGGKELCGGEGRSCEAGKEGVVWRGGKELCGG